MFVPYKLTSNPCVQAAALPESTDLTESDNLSIIVHNNVVREIGSKNPGY